MLLNHTTPAPKVHSAAISAPGSAIPFARLPHALAADTRLSPTDRLVGAALLFWACDRSSCEMSNAALGDYLGVSAKTVERALGALAALGYVALDRVRPTPANMTGRVVRLRWIDDPTVLPAAPSRSRLRVLAGGDVRKGPNDPQALPVGAERTAGRDEPPTPVSDPPRPVSRGGPDTDVPPPPTPAPPKEDRPRRTEDAPKIAGDRAPGRRRPQATGPARSSHPRRPSCIEEIATHAPDAGAAATPAPVRGRPPRQDHASPGPGMTSRPGTAPSTPRRSRPPRGADPSPCVEIISTHGSAPPGEVLTAGQRAAVAALSEAERARLGELPPARRAALLAPFRMAYEPTFLEAVTRRELTPPGFLARPAPVDHTTAGLVAAVADGDPRYVAALAESLCRDFGGAGDRRRWGAIHGLAQQLHRRVVSPEDLLDAHRQAMGPKAENRGAVFTHALRRVGWTPAGRTVPAGPGGR